VCQRNPCLLLPSTGSEPKRKSLTPNANLAMKKGFARPLRVGLSLPKLWND
jgi:hypothetical protein